MKIQLNLHIILILDINILHLINIIYNIVTFLNAKDNIIIIIMQINYLTNYTVYDNSNYQPIT